MKGILVLLGLFLRYLQSSSANMDDSDAVNGYVDKSSQMTPPMPHLSRTWREALVDHQLLNNSNAIGKLDGDTKKLMELPTCRYADNILRRSKRYVLLGSRWGEKILTYRIWSYPVGMSRRDVNAEIGRAFKTWTRYADIEIYPENKGRWANFNIYFVSRDHEDGSPLDGPRGLLGHAFPPVDGDIHFDSDESWTKDSSKGINLYQVAVHEIGHALGLGHPKNRDFIMYEFYSGYDSSSHLDSDDILAIQTLYGAKKS